MARKTLKMLQEEKEKHEEKGKKLMEKIKDMKRQQGERVAFLAVESGVTELEISDNEWREIFNDLNTRFQK